MEASFSEFLKNRFHERSRRNPRYSLRSFARDLGMAPSTLSEVLAGKKGISRAKAERIGDALRLPEWQRSLLQALAGHGKNGAAASHGAPSLPTMSTEAFASFASWIDLAILEAVGLPQFNGRIRWLAEALGIELAVAREAVARLRRHGLLELRPDGCWIDRSASFTTSDGPPSDVVRAFHRGVLERMAQALNEELPRRTLKSVVLTIAEDELPEARAILDEAVAKLVALGQRTPGARRTVVAFSAQLARLLSETPGRGGTP